VQGLCGRLGAPRLFGEEEEKAIADFVRLYAATDRGLRARELIFILQQFINIRASENPAQAHKVGMKWLRGFRKRHNVSLKVAQHVEVARFRAENPVVLTNWLKSVGRDLLDMNRLRAVVCIDETWMGETSTKRLLSPRGEPCRQVKAELGTHITLTGVITLEGEAVGPFITYASASGVHDRVAQAAFGECKGTALCATANGWTTSDTFKKLLDFLAETFNPTAESRLAVFLDGASVHKTREALVHATSKHILLIFYPAHTTHVLQSLDVGIFRPLKARFDALKDDILDSRRLAAVLNGRSMSGRISIEDGVRLSCRAYRETCTKSLIMNAWAAVGIMQNGTVDPSKVVNLVRLARRSQGIEARSGFARALLNARITAKEATPPKKSSAENAERSEPQLGVESAVNEEQLEGGPELSSARLWRSRDEEALIISSGESSTSETEDSDNASSDEDSEHVSSLNDGALSRSQQAARQPVRRRLRLSDVELSSSSCEQGANAHSAPLLSETPSSSSSSSSSSAPQSALSSPPLSLSSDASNQSPEPAAVSPPEALQSPQNPPGPDRPREGVASSTYRVTFPDRPLYKNLTYVISFDPLDPMPMEVREDLQRALPATREWLAKHLETVKLRSQSSELVRHAHFTNLGDMFGCVMHASVARATERPDSVAEVTRNPKRRRRFYNGEQALTNDGLLQAMEHEEKERQQKEEDKKRLAAEKKRSKEEEKAKKEEEKKRRAEQMQALAAARRKEEEERAKLEEAAENAVELERAAARKREKESRAREEEEEREAAAAQSLAIRQARQQRYLARSGKRAASSDET
jgi:hypothetical protein